jgi:hypothetical protein
LCNRIRGYKKFIDEYDIAKVILHLNIFRLIPPAYSVQNQVIPIAQRALQLFRDDAPYFEEVRRKTLIHWL